MRSNLYTKSRARPLAVVAVCAALLIAGYGVFEARRLIAGPQISIISPKNSSATSSTAVVVQGYAHNVSFLTINDKPAFTDESGAFAFMVSPPPGYTVLTVAAVDRFGRRAQESVSLTVFNYCHV